LKSERVNRPERRESDLHLVDGLPRFLRDGGGVGLLRIRISLRAGQRPGILGDRHVHAHADQRELCPRELGGRADERVRQLLAAVLAIAVAVGVADVAHVRDTAGRAAEQPRVALEAIRAGKRPKLRGERRGGRLAGTQIDDTARRVAVERRRRAANDLDAVDGLQIHVIDRRLPVGERERHAVAKNANAPRAELRSRAEPADRHASVL
jgi:hypothetical protein